MKILLCHNYYQQRGGEYQVFQDEQWLLSSQGHEVVTYTRHNDELENLGRLSAAKQTIWNRRTYQELGDLIRRERPVVMHCTNTFPLISPAAYYAARRAGVAVVQSLHNYRLLCANSLFLRDGEVCEDCLGRCCSWPGVAHRCYRGNRSATAALAAMQLFHRIKGTWQKAVDRYVALSEYSRGKFIAGGLPAERIVVKPNFVHPDPGVGQGRGDYVISVGRLSEEKGIATLLVAWQRHRLPLKLKIIGDGPLAEEVKAAAAGDERIEWLGRLPTDRVLDIVGDALCLVQPSLCFENCPKTVLEAFAKGTPVVASRLGAIAEMVDHDSSGRLFEPGDAVGMIDQFRHLLDHSRRLPTMRKTARSIFSSRYTVAANYQRLMSIYRDACQQAGVAFPEDRSTAQVPGNEQVCVPPVPLAAPSLPPAETHPS